MGRNVVEAICINNLDAHPLAYSVHSSREKEWSHCGIGSNTLLPWWFLFLSLYDICITLFYALSNRVTEFLNGWYVGTELRVIRFFFNKSLYFGIVSSTDLQFYESRSRFVGSFVRETSCQNAVDVTTVEI